jgi:peptidoglycan/LPS O-acetylase OafA/YrhL
MIGVVGLFAVPSPYAAGAIFVLSLVVAEISYRLFERPFFRGRTHGVPGRRQSGDDASVRPIRRA